MTVPVNSLIRKVLRKDVLNVYIYPYDGFYERNLCLTGHNFFVNSYKLEDKPSNLHIVNDSPKDLPIYLDIDLVILNNRTQYERASSLSNFIHVPLILIDHYHPHKLKDYELKDIIGKTESNVTIASNQILKDMWQDESIIEYGVEIINSTSKDGSILIYGDFVGQDYKIVQYLQQNPNVIVKGNTPGISEPCSDTELVSLISKASIYVNLSTEHSVNYNLLRAMGAGCCIISNNIPIFGNILNNTNSIVCTKLSEFKDAMGTSEVDSLGQKARADILANYNITTFVKKWTKTLEQADRIVFRK